MKALVCVGMVIIIRRRKRILGRNMSPDELGSVGIHCECFFTRGDYYASIYTDLEYNVFPIIVSFQLHYQLPTAYFESDCLSNVLVLDELVPYTYTYYDRIRM